MNFQLSSETSSSDIEFIFVPKGKTREVIDGLAFSSNLNDVFENDFEGEKGTSFSFFPSDFRTKRLIVVGIGDSNKISDFRNSVRIALFNIKKLKASDVVLNFHWITLPEENIIRASVRATLEAFRQLDQRKKEPTDIVLPNVTLVKSSWSDQANSTLIDAQSIAELRMLVSDWVDAPANELKPQQYASHIQTEAEKLGIQVTLFQEDQLKELGLNGILAVGDGSSDRPVMVQLSYIPEKKAENSAPIALIGKGVTFDTGGVSIKGSSNMHWMKCDMAGSAVAVAGVFLAAKMKLNRPVITVVGLAENMLDGKAFLPSSIIKMYSGHSAEVLDTDAEGRLVLADCLAWANKNHNPEIMIDFATLTGSCVSALGYHAAGLFTQSEELAESLTKSGNSSTDRVWRLPLWDEYNDQIQSDMADIKNLGGPAGGAITAAKFLELFTEKHPNWAHIDIAGVSLASTSFAKDRTATGFGVDLLYDWFRSL